MFNGRRQPSCDGTSRMTRECQVRICERLGVKFPGPTRQRRRRRLGPVVRLCPKRPKSRRKFQALASLPCNGAMREAAVARARRIAARWCDGEMVGSRIRMSALPVRRDKAALSSGCESHPANAPAGSNRSSYGGDEVAEAFG
jgi:hypothetical protein